MTAFTEDQQWAYDFLKLRNVHPTWEAMESLIATRALYEQSTPEERERALAWLVDARAWLPIPKGSGGTITVQLPRGKVAHTGVIRSHAVNMESLHSFDGPLDPPGPARSTSPGKSAKVFAERARNKAARKSRKKGRK